MAAPGSHPTARHAAVAGPDGAGPQVPRIPRPRDPEVLDALLRHARADQVARPRAARVLADVIDRLLDERLAATPGGPTAP